MPESRGLEVTVSVIVFSVLATAFVVARLIARVKMIKNAGPDEWTIVVSLVAAIVVTGLVCRQVKYGLGKHNDQLTPEDQIKMLKHLWINIVFYNASLGLTKTSILLQYLRVFVGTRIRFACWFSIGVVFCYAMWAIFSNLFACTPIAFTWDKSLHGHCIERKFLWLFNASFNIISDVVILVLPMPVLSSLKLPRKQKFVLMAIFAAGGLVCLISVIRLHDLYRLLKTKDLSWDNATVAIWSTLEIHLGIICASLPTLKPVISWLFPSILSTKDSHLNGEPSPNAPSTFYSRNQYRSTHIPLHDMVNPPGPTTSVQARNVGDQATGGGSGYGDDDYDGLNDEKNSSKDIMVTMAVTQDIESKSEMGSEKDLIIRH
ncbi:hypothetical protein PVAG01_08015 [Phlyctema vagabunda]|uniref:Rhodopsin domain-containing protein n=1 Tax=Phlyctema vagabunda TaxID=108571 RepID=A0ABR4PE16_9HELO